MRLLVCGGRDYRNWTLLESVLDLLGPTVIIEGGARGADASAAYWAQQRGVEHVQVVAEWEKYGKRAGHLRNGEMLKWKPDMVLAFPGGRGTADMVAQARMAGIPVVEV